MRAAVISPSPCGQLARQTVQQPYAAAFKPSAAPRRSPRIQRLVVRAAGEDAGEDEFEARLAALKQAKGETAYGAGRKAGKKAPAAAAPGNRPSYDFTDEQLYLETGPHVGDVAVNVALGATLVWLPLSIAAVGRGAFVKYRFTDRRLSVITTAPWKNEQLDAAYQEVESVVSIGRGVGAWGDMVITLKGSKDKIEMRALPRYKELERYILQRRDELTGGGSGGARSTSTEASTAAGKGFA